MKILVTSLYIGLLITTTALNGQAMQLTHADEFYQPSFNIDETEFSMFPEEKEVENFPNALIETEADPQVLGKYYEAVAQAYRSWGEKQKNLVNTYKINAQAEQEKLFWTYAKTSDFSRGKPMAQARVQAIGYYKQSYYPSFFKLALISKKADFYQDIAETYKMLQTS